MKDSQLKDMLDYINRNEYKSSSSKILIESFTAGPPQKIEEDILLFLDDPISEGTKLQQTVCHYTNHFLPNNSVGIEKSYSSFEVPGLRRVNSARSLTG